MATRIFQLLASAVTAVVLAIALMAEPANALDPRDVEVAARYEISFAGLEIGSFDFRAKVKDARYKLEGRGKVKALLGAFKWDGAFESEGFVNGASLLPNAYRHKFHSKRKLLFKTKKKRDTVEMAFRDGRVNGLDVDPPAKTGGRVPIAEEHLRDVLDPLSAIMALSDLSTENPCKRSIEVFDGKTRFRLSLDYAGRDRVSGRGAAYDYECSLRYVPIAGHKQRDEETDHLASRGDIVVVLRTFPSAQLALAREVRISTIAGTAVAKVKDANLVAFGRPKVALIR